MQKTTLDSAIRLGQLIRLLTPLANASKPFNKRLSRLRSTVDELVVLAALPGEKVPDIGAAAAIEAVYQALRASMVRHLNIKQLLHKARAGREVYIRQVATPWAAKANVEETLLADAEAVQLVVPGGTSIPQEHRASVLHAYASAVKNSSWMFTLRALDLDLETAGAESVALEDEHSSHPGRTALQATLLKLCPTYAGLKSPGGSRARFKKPVVKAAGLFITQVSLNAEVLLSQPEIAALADTAFLSPKAQPSLAALLKKAETPVVVCADETAEAVAQRIVDELVTGLVARRKALELEKESQRKKAESAAKASIVEALKQLSPDVLKVLKSNPELLQRV